MCNRYGYAHPYNSLVDEFSESRIPIVQWNGAQPNAPRDQIRPTNMAPVLRPVDSADPAKGLELIELRWGLIPWFHKRAIKDWKVLGTNVRSETIATTATFREAFKRRRCLVPATHFFEWTGEKGAKVMWKFSVPEQHIFCFAGLWDRAETADGVIESFTLATCAPGPDCSPYHSRQPVILKRDQRSQWLDLGSTAEDLLQAGGAGEIRVERAAA